MAEDVEALLDLVGREADEGTGNKVRTQVDALVEVFARNLLDLLPLAITAVHVGVEVAPANGTITKR